MGICGWVGRVKDGEGETTKPVRTCSFCKVIAIVDRLNFIHLQTNITT